MALNAVGNAIAQAHDVEIPLRPVLNSSSVIIHVRIANFVGVRMHRHAVVQVVGVLLVHLVNEIIGFPRSVDIDLVLRVRHLVDLLLGLAHGLGNVNEAVTLNLIVDRDLLTLLGNRAMLAITEFKEASLHVELVNLIILAGLGDIRGGVPQLIVDVHLDGVLHHGVAFSAVLVRAGNKRVAAGELLTRLTGRVRLRLVPVAANHGVLLVEGRSATINVALKRTAGNVGHPILLRSGSVVAALIVLVADLEITNAKGLGMTELGALVGPGNTAVGIGALLCVQELNHVSGICGVTTADTVDHDDLGVHLFGELGNLKQAEGGHKAGLTWVVVEAVDLRGALDLGRLGIKVANRLGPHVVVRNRATGIAQGAESGLLIQCGEVILDGAVRIHRAVPIVRIAVIDTE